MLRADRQITYFGPPGTGKTTRLVEELARLIESDYAPQEVAYTSFTNTAAEVAVRRACEATGHTVGEFRYFGTVHSLAGRLSGLDWNRLIDRTGGSAGDNLQRFADEYHYELSRYQDEVQAADPDSPDAYLRQWNFLRSRLRLEPERRNGDLRYPLGELDSDDEQFEEFVRDYQEFKAEHGLLDFTDSLWPAILGGSVLPVEVLILDEAQDLSPLQWKLVDQWSAGKELVLLAGDDDQAIYTFQGTRAEDFLERAGEGEVEELERSYRLPRRVYALSNSISARITRRKRKDFTPTSRSGRVKLVHVNYIKTVAEDDPERDWLVLARTNSQVGELVSDFLDDGVPFLMLNREDAFRDAYRGLRMLLRYMRDKTLHYDDLFGLQQRLQRFTRRVSRMDRSELANLVVDPEELELNPGVDLPEDPDLRGCRLALERIGLVPDFRIQLKAHHPRLTVALASGLDRQIGNHLGSLLEENEEFLESRLPNVRIGTIHRAKGDEADCVALLPSLTPRSCDTLEEEPDNEHRVWYVGVSRAREGVFVIKPDRFAEQDLETDLDSSALGYYRPLIEWPLEHGE